MENTRKIRWLKLKEEAENITGKKINLVATAGFTESKTLRGAIEIEKDYMTIYLNLDYNKTEQDAIETIAHELTHASGGTGHDREFFMREEEMKSKFMKKFYPEK